MKNFNLIIIIAIISLFLFESDTVKAQGFPKTKEKQTGKNLHSDWCEKNEADKVILFSKSKKWEFKTGENVIINIAIKNNYVDDVFFIRANTFFDFKISVKNNKGEKIKLSQDGEKRIEPPEIGSRMQIKLAKCEEFEFMIELYALYELKPGKYTIEVERKILTPDKKSRITVKSKPFFLTIK